jgi:hypothetical protein
MKLSVKTIYSACAARIAAAYAMVSAEIMKLREKTIYLACAARIAAAYAVVSAEIMKLRKKAIYLACAARIAAAYAMVSAEIMKLPKKTIYLACATCIAAVCVMISVEIFALSPQRKAIRDIEAIINDMKAEVDETHTKGQDSNSIFRQELSLAHQTLSRFVVSSEQAADFAIDIDKMAKQAGLQDFSSTHRMLDSYGPINECRHILEGRMQIKFKSSFTQFAKFINSLERYKPVIFVDTFKIKLAANVNEGHQVEMVLTFFVGQDSLKDIMGADRPVGAKVMVN